MQQTAWKERRGGAAAAGKEIAGSSQGETKIIDGEEDGFWPFGRSGTLGLVGRYLDCHHPDCGGVEPNTDASLAEGKHLIISGIIKGRNKTWWAGGW